METSPWRPGDPESMAEDAENDANSQADSLIGYDATHGLRKSCRKRTYKIMMLESLPRCCYYMAQGKGVFFSGKKIVAVAHTGNTGQVNDDTPQ